MTDTTAVRELANTARNLLARLREIDTELPESIALALEYKIEHYACGD